MSESRICPVCENEIPEDARFECPHCHLNLIWLDDEIAIQEARQKFTGELFTVEKQSEKGVESHPEKVIKKSQKPNKIETLISKYIGIGFILFIVSLVVGLAYALNINSDWGMLIPVGFLVVYIGFGLIAGLIFGVYKFVSRLRKK